MNGNDAWRAVAELAASQHGAFNTKQAASNGINSRQLRAAVARGRLRRPLSDVFVFESHPSSFRQRCSIASLAGAVISHRGAAILHEFDGFNERAASAIEVCFERDHRRELPGVVQHTWTNTNSDDIAVVDGINCTSKARTLFQLGAVCPREQVEVALDSALRTGVSARWIEATARRLRRSGPTGGSVLFDLMYDATREGSLTESVLERLVERILRVPGLPAPIRQYQVATDSGIKRLDLAFPGAKLGIEAHSRAFHFGHQPEQADNLRDIELAAVGWEIIYVSWAMAHDPDRFVSLVQTAWAERQQLFAQAVGTNERQA